MNSCSTIMVFVTLNPIFESRIATIGDSHYLIPDILIF